MGSSVSSDVLTAAQIALLATTGFDGILWPKQAILKNNTSYDYIVVGGGSAGCVVSARLAECKDDTVLLLEAGGNPPKPALIASTFDLYPHSFVDYNYTSTRDEYAARSQNNYTMITAGKMLGGSDSLNHMVHSRGPPSVYDCWAKLVNDKSWKYENILQYFKKSEKVDETDEILKQYPVFHGTDGPMGLTRQPEEDVIKIKEAFAEVGNPTVLDLNANIHVGYTEPQFMFADGKRQTPALVYLKPVIDYPNLYVSKYTTVTKIIFKGNVAVGVEAFYKGKTYTFRANKEVILSAGVFNTPQLLMLSGIGPKSHLDSFKIPVIKDLPVGTGLVDHVIVTVVHKLKKYLVPVPDVTDVGPNIVRYPFPTLLGSVPFDKIQTCPDYADFNLFFPHDSQYLTLACSRVFGLRNEICDRWEKEVILRDSLYSVLALLDPTSRGSVCLGCTDPFAKPVITTGYYKNKDDLKTMIKIVKDFLTVDNSTYLKKIEAELVGLDLEECAGKEKCSDEFWECYILEHTSSPYHFCCTCAMGKVVDCNLKVIGIKRLRIVDASVMPKIPGAAPNAAVIMLAEKAADMIKYDNKCS